MLSVLLLAGCTSAPEAEKEETAPEEPTRFETIEVLPPDGSAMPSGVSYSVQGSDDDGYNFALTFSIDDITHTSDNVDSKPGETALTVTFSGAETFENLTDGRNAPLGTFGHSSFAALWPLGSHMCNMFDLGTNIYLAGNGSPEVPYCPVGVIKSDIADAELAPNGTVEGGLSGVFTEQVPEADLAALEAEIETGPVGWAGFTDDDFTVGALGDCRRSATMYFWDNPYLFWSSVPVPNCAVPNVGVTPQTPVDSNVGATATANLPSVLPEDDKSLDECPLGSVDEITAGRPGDYGEFETSAHAQAFSCTAQSVKFVLQDDSGANTPEDLADAFGDDVMASTQVIEYLGGEMFAYCADGCGIYWNYDDVSIHGKLGQEPTMTDAEEMQDYINWFGEKLPGMLAKLAAA